VKVESGTPANSRRGMWSWIVSTALAVVLLYFALRGVDWRRVGQMIASASWKPLLASASITCVSFFMRAVRWRILLNATAKLSVGEVYWANMAGYFGNQYLPARAGELIRTVLISNRSPLSKTYVFTTALSERLMDVIALVLGSSIVLLGVNPKPSWMQDLSKTMAIVAGAGAVAIMIIPHTSGLLERLIAWMPLPERIRKIALVLAEQILSGMRAFHDWGRFAAFVFLTILIWAADALSTMACAQSVGVHISFRIALLVLTALGLSSALPSTPGYVGIFQFVAVTVLAPFGIDRDAALAYILLLQAQAYILVLPLGMPGLLRFRRAKQN
jgi:uncharacterized protein (TIRG00374 family)